jgi:membrane peptidoglycan carboxypeptidase
MSEEKKRILEMLAQGKINTDEAERLLSALSKDEQTSSGQDETGKRPEPKYLRVVVEPAPGSDNSERVNIRVPYKLIRAGLKLASFIPKNAQDKVNEALQGKGMETDFSKIKPEDLEEIIRQLDDLSVNVDGKETVRIFSE